jgi:hypothetical protein
VKLINTVLRVVIASVPETFSVFIPSAQTTHLLSSSLKLQFPQYYRTNKSETCCRGQSTVFEFTSWGISPPPFSKEVLLFLV